MNLFDPAFACYAMHKDAIEAFIHRLARADDPNDADTQLRIAQEVALHWDLLTSDEIKYIERRVSALC